MKNFIPLTEFAAASGIPAEVLVWALGNGKLRCAVSESGSVLVDVDALESRDVLAAFAELRAEYFKANETLTMERCARMIGDFFDSALDVAVSRARNK